MTTTLVGLCPDRATIGRAVERLESAGFSSDGISVMIRADSEEPLPDAGIDTRPDAGQAAVAGGMIGAAAGAGLTGAVAVAGLTLSGVGVLAAGPLAALLAAAVSGGVASGLTGAIIGVGIPEDVARRYVTNLERGAGLVAVGIEESSRPAAECALAEAGVAEAHEVERPWVASDAV